MTKNGNRRDGELGRGLFALLAILFNLVASPLHAAQGDGHRFCASASASDAVVVTADAGAPDSKAHSAPASHVRHCDACPLSAPALAPDSTRIAERVSFAIVAPRLSRPRQRTEISSPASHWSRAPPFFS